MKLCRIGPPGREAPAIVDAGGTVRSLAAIVPDIDAPLIARGGLADLANFDLGSLPAVTPARFGPPVGGIGKIIGVGLNYTDHAAELGLPLPSEPLLFMKACAASGPNDPVPIPKGSTKMDWEVELGIVVGRRAANIAEAEAPAHIAGYVLVHDVTERAFQHERGGQWVKGKSNLGFAPVGPWLVTPDEIADPQRLGLWLHVNGVRKQTGNTRNMVFGAYMLVAYVSQFMVLEPGDLITTGTPAGVGAGVKPTPTWLKPGDTVRLGVDGLGEQRQQFVI